MTTATYHRLEGWGYPDGVRLAVNFTIDYDAQLNRRAQNEPPMELTQKRGWSAPRIFGNTKTQSAPRV